MIVQYISEIRTNSKIDNIFKFGGSKFKGFGNFTIRKHKVNILLIPAHKLLEQPLKTDFNAHTISVFYF